MKLIFHPNTKADLKWFRRYYASIFPEGEKAAKHHYLQIFKTLLDHPYIGEVIGVDAAIREIFIPRTPFSFVYTVSDETIIVLRVLDNRAERPM